MAEILLKRRTQPIIQLINLKGYIPVHLQRPLGNDFPQNFKLTFSVSKLCKE